MKNMKQAALGLAILLTACSSRESSSSIPSRDYGPNYDPINSFADQSYLYGMTDLSWSEHNWNGTSWQDTHDLIEALGAKSVRVWLHCNWIMKNPDTYDENGLALARKIVEDWDRRGMQMIGMNHSNFHATGYANSKSTTAKPARDLTEGSEYMKWLEDYERTWKNLVLQFPEITYWEIDNEGNNDVFFGKLSGGTFTLRQKADIYTDMMFYASRGIHEANPKAITVMGGLITSSAETFLQYIYDNIDSGDFWSTYPDDFFQVACWHPYVTNFRKEAFKKLNNDIYAVIKQNEQKDKKVFMTEFGFSEENVSVQVQADYIPLLFETLKELPYVESLHYFRMFDVLSSSWGSTAEKTFGLFTDPNNHGIAGENKTLAAPKKSAYAYQKAAGGTGSLTTYQEKVN